MFIFLIKKGYFSKKSNELGEIDDFGDGVSVYLKGICCLYLYLLYKINIIAIKSIVKNILIIIYNIFNLFLLFSSFIFFFNY